MSASPEWLATYPSLQARTRRLLARYQLLARQRSLSQVILNACHEGIVFLDAQARVQACNPAAERILGREAQSLHGLDSAEPEVFSAIDEDGCPIPEEAHPSRQVLRSGQPCLNQVQGVRNASGQLAWLQVNGEPLHHRGQLEGVVVSFADITRAKTLEQRLRHEAYRDELTDLYNRRYFMEALSRAMIAARRHGHPMCLCFCDLDHFKGINDTWGHATGDRAIQAFSETISGALRRDDLAARLGGDEFALLFSHSPAYKSAVFLERLRIQIEGLVLNPGSEPPLRLTASFGVVDFQPTYEPEQFLEAADRALYRAKERGRNRVELVEGT